MKVTKWFCFLFELLTSFNFFLGSSERTIINPATLEKLLYILNLRNFRTSTDLPDNQLLSSDNPVSNAPFPVESESEILKLKQLVKELSEKNDFIEAEMEKMKVLERNYEELVRSSELCDDDKNQLLIRSLRRCHEFETNLLVYERKIEFLKSENDNIYRELKVLRLSSLGLVSDFKMEILEKSAEIELIEEEENGSTDDSDVDELRLELQKIRSQLGGLCFNVLKNIKSIDDENVPKIDANKLSNITVLENNHSTFFITRQEFNSMKSKIADMEKTIKAHENKESHLEELTKITQSQLKSQQLMLSQFSDDEISARHLIVDLQSQSNENYQLAKTTRELKVVKDREDLIKLEMEEMKSELNMLKKKLVEKSHEITVKHSELKERETNNLLKIQYLKKSLVDLSNQFSSMTPVYLIADFVKDYAAVLQMKKQIQLESIQLKSQATPEVTTDSIVAQLKTTVPKSDIEAKIKIVKLKSSCDYLKQQLEIQELTIRDLHDEVAKAKICEIKNSQHWKAVGMLFGGNGNGLEEKKDEVELKTMIDKQVQAGVLKKEIATNTDEMLPNTQNNQSVQAQNLQMIQAKISAIQEQVSRQSSCEESPPTMISPPHSIDNNQESLKSQLKKALMLASSRSALLIETENRLSESQGRIKILEKNMENRDKKERENVAKPQSPETTKKEDHILSITIATLQNLLLEKDTTLSRYQELLKSERQHYSRTYDESADEIKQLKRTVDTQDTHLNDKAKIIEKLKSQIDDFDRKLKDASRVHSRVPSPDAVLPSRHVTFNENEIELRSLEMKLKESQNEIKKMEQQLRDLCNIECQLKNTIHEKDATIKDLNVMLKASNDNLDTLSENFASTADIDQLRDMLEEKDKHIQDLTDTLNQFHDDQQKYINDSAINSAEQVHLISTDLNRADATNRIMKTQLEALKRQVTSIQQREKQAREMIKTLKNQLIRRPVISIKSDKRATTGGEDHQQKKIRELENELVEVKDELRRQVNINDNKKAKNAAELQLWDKQKRYQELSERLKTKLTEKEIDFERMKANFQIAKNSITRLEREKNMLENKLKSGRYLHNVNVAQQSSCVHCHPQKYPGTETPTTATSEFGSEMNHELISALKSRIESQQRRIISLELDGRGSTATANEIEKMQDHLSAVESQNIRLEAKNIQLQLDYDLVKQNGCGERQEARIKHLEE
jgi:centrosomal protein CEP290